MKRIVSILLVVMMFVSVFYVTASAASYDEFPETENKYYEKTIQYSLDKELIIYRELHYYSDKSNEEPDWALIACVTDFDLWELKYGALVGDRVIWSMACRGEKEFLSTGYAVYIPKSNTYIGVINDNIDRIIELCPNFVETIDELKIGQLMGDVNEDNKIDILDATLIQRVLVDCYDYPTSIRTVIAGYFSNFSLCDFDRDGETTIMDATKIQRHIAGLE